MIILYIIIGIIISIFILHFIGLYISDIIRKKYRNKFGYNIGNRLIIDTTYDRSLMVSTYHSTSYEYDDINDEYAHTISLTIGGFYIKYQYGKDFIIPITYLEEGVVKNYGLYSIDSEKFWRSIWWGKHLYTNPFSCDHFCGCWYMNMENGEWVNRNDIKDPYNLTDPYIVLKEENTTYTNKNNKKQIVPMITWKIEKREWCPLFLKWIGLSKLYRNRVIDLSFDISQNGSESFSGLGVNSDSYKGGVYGASIMLNNYPHILKDMKFIHKDTCYFKTFYMNILKLIDYFMKEEKKY